MGNVYNIFKVTLQQPVVKSLGVHWSGVKALCRGYEGLFCWI